MLATSVLCVLVVMTCYHGVSAVGIGNPCTKSEDCKSVEGAVCRDSVCTCANNYVILSSNKCGHTVSHGGECEEITQCNYSEGTECQNGKCKCKGTLNYNGERCVGSLGLGDICENDIECVVPFDPKQETVWCYSKECQCRNGFKRDDKRCVIGGDCTSDPDCKSLSNSFCNIRLRDGHQCACNNNYTAVANNTKCYPTVHEIGNGCEYDEQCSQALVNTECETNQCQCVKWATWNKTENSCTVNEIDARCESNEECSQIGKAECKNNQCSCVEGVTWNKDKAICAADRSVISISCLVLFWLIKLV